MLTGILNLDKPPGLSSARAVDRVKRLLPRGTKIGHAGTLDPFATGVLLLLIGKATKRCEELMGARKGYDAVVKLGARTPTDDPESQETITPDAQPPSRDAVLNAAARFVGQIQQTPPVFSALKVAGQRAYKLARGGHDVQMTPRPVTVYACDVLDYAWPLVKLRIECGRGTYIRAIARDLGDALDVGGYLTELRRTFVGEFRAEDAVKLEQLDAATITRQLQSS